MAGEINLPSVRGAPDGARLPRDEYGLELGPGHASYEQKREYLHAKQRGWTTAEWAEQRQRTDGMQI